MKTQITESKHFIIVSCNGLVSHETQGTLKDGLRALQSQETSKEIIFDFKDLEFVGSTGITQFIQTLKDFNSQSKVKTRYCNVGPEFKKFIRAFDPEEVFSFEGDPHVKPRLDH